LVYQIYVVYLNINKNQNFKNMELIEIEQHKLIINNCKKLLNVSFENDIDYLTNIINKSKNIINKYNNENLTIVDVTKKESGLWNSTIKKLVYGKYYNPIIKKINKHYDTSQDFEYACEEHKGIYTYEDGTEDWFFNVDKFCSICKKEYLKRKNETKKHYKKIEKIKIKFKNACNNTIFCKDLRLKCILLNRRIPNHDKVEPLLLAIKDTIRNEILKTFQEQNEILITKYI